MAAGIQPSGKNRGNDVYRVGAAARAIVAAEYGGATGPVIDPDTLGPKDRKDFWGGSNEELKFKQTSKLLVESQDHEDVIAELAKIFILAADTIPDLLERRCGLLPDQLEVVENAINEIRVQLDEKVSGLGR